MNEISLSKNQQKKQNVLSPTSRFNNTVSADEIASSSKGFVPTNTSRSTGWAYCVFQQWLEQRNRCTEEKYPDDLLMREEVYDCDTISGCLQRFVSEARRVDGTPYPPKRFIKFFVDYYATQRNTRQTRPTFWIEKTRDLRSCMVHAMLFFAYSINLALASRRPQLKVILDEDEKLWKVGVLNTTTPIGLQRAVFYYIGKACCLRGGEEQRGLKPSQFSRLYDLDRYEYTENGSKNRTGGFYQLGIDNKSVPIFKNVHAGERCLVSLLDLYLSKLPQAAIDKDIFYCKLLERFDKDSHWYSQQPRGKHTLANMVKSMFTEAGVDGTFTNHSLRATGATDLFQAGVPEKIIQEFTGHRSIKALRQYERADVTQKKPLATSLLEHHCRITVAQPEPSV